MIEQDAACGASVPWWRTPAMWIVVGGPLAVVVASIATAAVAWRGADEVIESTGSARVMPVRPDAATPAMLARNHAATAAASSSGVSTPGTTR